MLLKAFVSYLFQAQNEHAIHSPFLFEFYTDTIKQIHKTPAISWIEERRKTLENSTETIEITDFGAGSKWNKSNQRKVSSIARSSKKALKWRKFLFLLLKKYYPNGTIFELGTSFGFTTAYMASALQEGHLITFEGCSKIASIAQQTFDEGKLTNIHIEVGNITTQLPKKLAETNTVDVVFFDANHRYEPTIQYFEWCLAKATETSCFIFDDIYWSEEMKTAWQYICQHPSVTFSLDFFQIGIVFFRKKQPKQHFILKV